MSAILTVSTFKAVSVQVMSETPQRSWNRRNLDKIKAAGEKRDKKRVRVVLSFYGDRPSDVALLDWLKSQAGDGSVVTVVTRILQDKKDENMQSG